MGKAIPLRWAVKFRIQLNVGPTSVSSTLCKRNESIRRGGKEYIANWNYSLTKQQSWNALCSYAIQ
jgi:hypothetical protein